MKKLFFTIAACVGLLQISAVWAGVMYTGPGKVKDVKVASEQIYVRFEGSSSNPMSCNMDWSVYPSILADKNRILSALLFAKATNADVEVGVVDNDCHEGLRKLETIWVK
jgi:hypothetical protein